jgi:glutathione S-transferase
MRAGGDMKLYSGPLSLFTAKVRIALREKGLAAEIVDVPFGLDGYQPKHPEVVRWNPKAQVPVLVDGDLALWDSTVILEYLEDRHPEPALYPSDPVQRARCRQLELYADEVLFPPLLTLIREVFYKPDGVGRDAAAVSEARKLVAERHAELADRLGGREWFCDRFSVADVGIFLDCSFGAGLGAPVPDALPGLRAWLGRMLARPAVAEEARAMAAFRARLGGSAT